MGTRYGKLRTQARSHVRYEPEYGPDGRITGQHPMSRTEPQILRAEHVPQTPVMGLTDLELDETEPMLREKAADHDLTDPEDPAFRYLKAEVEEILNRNGYEIPVMADGTCSSRELPVYSRGVKKGQTGYFWHDSRSRGTGSKNALWSSGHDSFPGRPWAGRRDCRRIGEDSFMVCGAPPMELWRHRRL
mgnify:CR=1 FL=1